MFSLDCINSGAALPDGGVKSIYCQLASIENSKGMISKRTSPEQAIPAEKGVNLNQPTTSGNVQTSFVQEPCTWVSKQGCRRSS